MRDTQTLEGIEFDNRPDAPIRVEPGFWFFRSWMETFSLFRAHGNLLLGFTFLLASPFFVLNSFFHAHHMMTLGSAGLTQTEIPPEQLRVLMLSLVCGDALAFATLAIVTMLMFKYMYRKQPVSFMRHLLRELATLLCSLGFWLFAIAQVAIFMLINSQSGQNKIGGMLLFAASVLLLLANQDRDAPARGIRLRRLGWSGWFSLVLMLLSFPILFILLNGFADYLILILMDIAASKIQNLFEPGSLALPFGAIALSKLMSQWLNLFPMALLLCAYAAMRGVTVKAAVQ